MPSQEEDYGSLVKRRRQLAIEAMDESMSKSKRRKLAIQLEKEKKDPLKAFDKHFNSLYNDLLMSIRGNKKEVQSKCSSILTFLYEDSQSPLHSGENKAKYYCRPSISRPLQTILKVGSAADKQRILDAVLPELKGIVTVSAGYHLCVKLLKYCRNDIRTIFNTLLTMPKTFFSKYGSRVWDAVIAAFNECGGGPRQSPASRARHQAIQKIFLEKYVKDEVPNHMDLSVYDTLDKCKESTLKKLEERLKVDIDKLTTKELLRCELVQFFLSLILNPAVLRPSQVKQKGSSEKNNTIVARRLPIFQKEGRRDLAAALFEGSEALLSTQYGVRALCALCGYWSAKERKSFLSNMKKVMVLSSTNWMHYLCNSIDGVFLARFLSVLDDTKLAKEAILTPMFETDENIDQFLNSTAKTAALLLYVINPDEAGKYLRQVEIDQINFVSETSKKEPCKRRAELADWFQHQNKVNEKIKERIKSDSNDDDNQKKLSEVHQAILTKLFSL